MLLKDKVFTHIKHGLKFPDLQANTGENGRIYVTPEGNRYPSITTLLSKESEKGIENWRKFVGEKEADKIMKQSSRRGDDMHNTIEDYLNNEDYTINRTSGQLYFFKALKKKLHDIDNIIAQEIPLYSDKIQLAGRVDCIGEYNKKPSIIDFKTSRKRKKKKWIKNYFIQATFYSICFEELFGIKVKNLVILIANEDGTTDVFEENRDNFIEDLFKIREKHRKVLEEELLKKVG